MFLFADTLINIVATVGMIFVYLGIALLINKRINALQEKGKKGMIWWYLILFVSLVISVFVVLWFFNIDLIALLSDIWINIQSVVLDSIDSIIGTVITIFVASLLIRITKFFVKKTIERESKYQKRITTIMKVVSSIIKYAIYLITILVVLSLWNVNVVPALAGLGIFGLIIGMGAQSLVKDIIAGFFIIFDRQYDVGDIVEINSFKGEVVDIGLKSTRIKNWKQDISILANGSIGTIINYSKTNSVAVVKVGVSYESNIQEVIDILKTELPIITKEYPDVIEEPNILGVSELDSSSVVITIIIKTETEKHYGVERSVKKAVKEILDKHNIEIPYPHVTVTNK